MEVEVLSKEMIKPSSPNHSPTHSFSYLDQIAIPAHSPNIYYYQAPANQNQTGKVADNLKKSLSGTLALYYPLAGLLRQNSYIECNDEGVPFFEANAKGKLSQVIRHPEHFSQHKLLPYGDNDVADHAVMAVQLNMFECGGIAIATKISHQFMDGGSAVMFMKNWAAISRAEYDDVVCPSFESAAFFPPRKLIEFDPSAQTLTAADEKVVTKRLVFSPSKIDSLKAKYGHNNESFCPTRVEAVSVFLWLRFVYATRRTRNDEKVYVVSQMVNLRKRMSPALGDNYVGNFIGFVSAKVAAISLQDSSEQELLYSIVKQWRDSLRDITGDYLTSLQQASDDHQNYLKDIMERASKGEWEMFMFSSLCKYPLYEVDFGWGKPVLLSALGSPDKNKFLLRDARTGQSGFGEGIEVWVNLKEEDMALFESDTELLAFAEI